ncbi:MAG: thioesterase family protein [Ginsengibacter sp.]
MARVKLYLPENVLGTFRIPVRITDINYGNHLGNAALVEIIHEVRVQFLQTHGFTELNAGGIALIMNELVVEYKNESFYNDHLIITVSCGDITKVSFELYYEISVVRDQEKFLIAIAKTGMVGYDYTVKKVTAISNEMKEILNAQM